MKLAAPGQATKRRSLSGCHAYSSPSSRLLKKARGAREVQAVVQEELRASRFLPLPAAYKREAITMSLAWSSCPSNRNHEGERIDGLQAEAPHADAVVINPGGLAHYSVALRDTLEDTKLPVVEVHISDPAVREPFRHALITATAATTVIAGKRLGGYLEALDFLAERRHSE